MYLTNSSSGHQDLLLPSPQHSVFIRPGRVKRRFAALACCGERKVSPLTRVGPVIGKRESTSDFYRLVCLVVVVVSACVRVVYLLRSGRTTSSYHTLALVGKGSEKRKKGNWPSLLEKKDSLPVR